MFKTTYFSKSMNYIDDKQTRFSSGKGSNVSISSDIVCPIKFQLSQLALRANDAIATPHAALACPVPRYSQSNEQGHEVGMLSKRF